MCRIQCFTEINLPNFSKLIQYKTHNYQIFYNTCSVAVQHDHASSLVRENIVWICGSSNLSSDDGLFLNDLMIQLKAIVKTGILLDSLILELMTAFVKSTEYILLENAYNNWFEFTLTK